jgi:hypothetical protein
VLVLVSHKHEIKADESLTTYFGAAWPSGV